MRSRRLGRRVAAFLGHEVVTLTDQDTEQWQRAFPRAPARILTISNPLSFPRPPSNPYDPSNRIILAIGWLDPRKGFDLLLEAWSRLEREFPQWSLRIIGSGPEENQLRLQARALSLERCVLAGQTDQIEQEYLSAGIYALSSRAEGLPMVLIESQAYGVPAVAFDCPTGPAQVLAGGGGLLVPPEDVPRFTQALHRLLSDARARQQLSERAYQGSERYTAQQVLDQWAALLDSA